MKTSRGLHKVAQEQVQRSGAALVCHQGINAQASVKQLFPVPINLMRGNVLPLALHLTLAQVISGRHSELPLSRNIVPGKILLTIWNSFSGRQSDRKEGGPSFLVDLGGFLHPPARTPPVFQVHHLPLHALLRQRCILFKL